LEDSLRTITARGLLVLTTTLFITTSLFTPTAAEKLSLASFDYEYVPNAELDRTGNEADELKSDAHTSTLKFAVPLLLSGTDRMVLNFFTLRTLYQTYGPIANSTYAYRPDYLYSFKYGLVFMQRLSPKWKLAVLVQPSLLSDLENVKSRHVLLRAGFLFEKKVSDRFKYALGFGYSDDYGQVRLLPVVRLKWKPSSHWVLDVDLPSKVRVWRDFSARLRCGLLAKVTGAHYRVGEAVEFPDGRTTEGGSVKYSILNVGPAFGFALYREAYLTFNTGYSVYRKFEVFDAEDHLLEDSDFEANMFFKLAVEYQVGE
jgi:hypothetical protein